MGFHAKRLGGTVLRILLQTRLGALCAASLAAGCSGLVTLATKAVFLGQLSPSESSQLSEVRRLDAGCWAGVKRTGALGGGASSPVPAQQGCPR